tara:strand:- start:766 stop:1191 length:426 start_codon:yes stop_codon:yes gene_type:complete
MKQWLKKVTGIEAEEKRIAEEEQRISEEKAALEAKEMEQLKVRDPKAYATKKKEPWVNVLDVKVNQDNVRNGFFELDWNKYFIEQLIGAGYGEKGDAEEQIVDRWFKDIVYNMFVEEGIDTDRGAGYINVVPIDQGKSEVS